ncbi:MAG: phosphotransferase [Dehalococcoidia bacterium]
MEIFDAWPAPVTDHLRDVYGVPVAVEQPGGMSGASVHRVRFAMGSVIVKASVSPRESLFYRHAGERLERGGVFAPHLLWSGDGDGLHWLVLEDIPTPAPSPPSDRWFPNPDMVAMIARLHTLALDLPAALSTYKPWDWTVEVTESALSFFPASVARTLASPLRSLRDEAQHLGVAWCWISGDPNPSNWGMRDDGSLVLYDWELVRRGAPPTDVAILVAGLGDEAKYDEIAACYLTAWRAMTDAPPWSPSALSRDIALAKVWSVATLLRACMTGKANVPQRVRDHLSEFVPPWVRSLAH